MTCKKVGKRAILYLYNDLARAERREFDEHLDSCENCRRMVEQKKALLQAISMGEKKESDPRWDQYWEKISQRVNQTGSRPWFGVPSLKWGFALAGFAFFLILGILVGRLVLTDSRILIESRLQEGDYRRQSVLAQYFEDMKPVMLDLSNSVLVSGDRHEVVEREVIETMLIQTRLLSHRFSGQDPHVEALLSDIEIILIEISNRVPGDRKTTRSIRNFIKDREIPIKIDLFQQRVQKLRKI
jgi:hypothetical protein